MVFTYFVASTSGLLAGDFEQARDQIFAEAGRFRISLYNNSAESMDCMDAQGNLLKLEKAYKEDGSTLGVSGDFWDGDNSIFQLNVYSQFMLGFGSAHKYKLLIVDFADFSSNGEPVKALLFTTGQAVKEMTCAWH